jgi:hypothetical protein
VVLRRKPRYTFYASVRHRYMGSLFLDPEDIRMLGLVAIWKEAPVTWYRYEGKKGPVLRPRCIGPD